MDKESILKKAIEIIQTQKSAEAIVAAIHDAFDALLVGQSKITDEMRDGIINAISAIQFSVDLKETNEALAKISEELNTPWDVTLTFE